MDQLVLQWIGNRETGRHNLATEAQKDKEIKEAHRHNVATEVHNTFDSLRRAQATEYAARVAAAATRYASDNSRRAAEYSANTSAAASRYKTMMDSWNTLQHEITSRQANAIQSRFNEGKLAIAASEYQEQRRANLARETENVRSRQQSYLMHEKEMEYKYATHEYQKQRDWLERVRLERQFETEARLEMSDQVLGFLGDVVRAKGYQSKGGYYYGQSGKEQGQVLTSGQREESPQEFWKRLSEGFDRELSR